MTRVKTPCARSSPKADLGGEGCIVAWRHRHLRGRVSDWPSFSSGFYVLVGGKLAILTNNHVLPDKKAASIAVAVFQTANMGTVEVALYPQKLWHTSPKEELDYTLVACEVPQGVQPVELVRSALLGVEQGDTIIIVQHPDGGEKSASSGPVFKVHPPYLTYQADTLIGSSGSPVLKDYEPVALHHCAPRDEAAGGGSGLLGSLSCTAQRNKHSNKGILLTAILLDLETKMGNTAGKGKDASAGGDGAAGATDASASSNLGKLAILQRLREGAASCVARRTAGSTTGDGDKDGPGGGMLERSSSRSSLAWPRACWACAPGLGKTQLLLLLLR